MIRLTYIIEPQRSLGRGFHPCAPHQAQRWAVVEIKEWRQGKRNYCHARTVARFSNSAKAHSFHVTLTRIAEPPSKPGLGQRFVRTGRKIIARSLSYNQYHGLKP